MHVVFHANFIVKLNERQISSFERKYAIGGVFFDEFAHRALHSLYIFIRFVLIITAFHAPLHAALITIFRKQWACLSNNEYCDC